MKLVLDGNAEPAVAAAEPEEESSSLLPEEPVFKS